MSNSGFRDCVGAVMTVVALLILLAATQVHASWTIQPPDVPKNFTNMLSRSIAIDGSTNRPHIAYGSDHLYHAYYTGSAWISETVDDAPGVGQYAAIAIDSLGKLHISYYDSTNSDLKYATNALGNWVSVTLDSGYVGFFSSIAVDGNNKVHISYRNNSAGTLKYISNSSGNWVAATVDSSGNEGYYSSIAVDSLNKAHISYYDSMNGGLRYATNSSGGWGWSEIDPSGGTYTSIAVDSANKIHISYAGAGLRYASNSTGGWVTATVDNVGSMGTYTSIALDSNNKVHISYFDQTNVDLKYATNASGSWVPTAVDGSGGTGNVGQYTSIAIDSADKAHISYYDILNKGLKYTANSSGSWLKTTVDTTGGVGEYTSAAVDSNDKIHISYYDSNNGADGNLKYATNTSGSWVVATVDSSGDVGQYSSIAVDTGGRVHISYYDVTNANLKYVTNASGSWVSVTVSSTNDSGKYSSLALDSNNKAHISYYYYDAVSTVNLRYVTNAAGSWSAPATVDAGANAGWYTSIAVDAANKAHISYCDLAAAAFDLKYATNASGGWVLTTVDSAAKVTMQTAIALDSNGKAHIAYYDSLPNYDLKYATNATGSWVLTTVDTANDVGQEASIAIDSSNKAHISYYDQTNLSLKYASNSPGPWYTYTIDEAGFVGKYSSIGRDSANKVHISYYDETNKDLKYITNAPIDITPPSGSITLKSGAIYSTSTSVPLSLTCGDLQSSCSQMQFSNDNASWSTPQAYAATVAAWTLAAGDGGKTVYARFKDSSGNWSDPVSDTIILDGTAPGGTSSINSGAALTNVATVSLGVTCSDATSGCDLMRFSNDNTTWTVYAYTATMPWTLSAGDGTKTVYVQFHDTAGSWSGSVGKSITLDSTAPTGTLFFNPNSSYATVKDVTLSLTCADTTSGCSQMRFSNNGTSWSPAAGYASGYSWDLNNVSYGGTAADGSKTVYVQFRDTAGNWSSAIVKQSITLDRVVPVGTITINNSAPFTDTTKVSLTLTCSDATSGCATMEFSNDGGSWSAAEAFGTSKNWSMTALDGTRSVAVRLTDNAGKSQVYSSAIILDSTAPGSTATPDGSGSQASAFTITLACSDGSGSGCAATYYTLDGSIPSTSSGAYSGAPIPVSGLVSPVTLRFFSVDNLGNAESHRSETYNFVAGYSTLTLDLASPTLLQNGLLDISGKLTRYPDSETLPNNGMDLSGLAVSLTVTGPTGSPCENGCSENTSTYSSLGHYRFQEIDRFSFKGTYTIQAHFVGSGLHQASNSATESLLVGASAGYAILVEGKVSSEEGLESHNKTTGRIYDTLKERGFVDDNILYFNYAGSIVPGVDAVPTKSAIQSAIEEWALARMNGAPAPLYVIFVDHGNRNTFYIDPDTITPTELNGWLATLESGLGASAMLEKRIVILGACYSGSFLTTLKQAPAELNAGRVIIASAAEDEQSYKGPNEPDGIRSGEFFMEELFKQLKMGASLKAAFVEAAALTRTFTSQGSASANAGNGYGDTSVQHPLLDDDGDGSGSNTLVDALGDGIESARLHLGFGVTNAALGPADLRAVAATHYLDSASSSTPTPLWSEAYSNAAVSSAWFEVKAPATLLVGTGGTGQLSLDIPKALMQLKPAGRWEPVAGSEPTFNNAGKYEVYYFTKSTNAEISEMKRSLVYKNYPGNPLPAPFNLVSPGAGGVTEKTRTELNLVWEGSSDLDGLTYTVQIATDNLFTNIVFQKEELGTTGYFVDESAGLSDKTIFFWRVQAVDTFGALRPSGQVGSFETDNTNALPGWIKGYVFNGSAVAVAGATVTAWTGDSIVAQAVTISGGAFVMVVPPGSYSVSASAAGYTDGSTGTFDMPSGEIHSIPAITLNAAQSTVQINVSGSGRVYQNPAGLDCSSSDPLTPGCHATVSNGSSISLIADASDWQYLFSAWSGITCGNDSSNTATLCTFSVNTDANITASFGPNYQARTSTGQGFSSLQLALNSAATDTTVQARAFTFQEAILLNRLDDAVLTVDGGCWGADYTPSAGGFTTISGLVTIQRGTLKISGPLAVR